MPRLGPHVVLAVANDKEPLHLTHSLTRYHNLWAAAYRDDACTGLQDGAAAAYASSAGSSPAKQRRRSTSALPDSSSAPREVLAVPHALRHKSEDEG